MIEIPPHGVLRQLATASVRRLLVTQISIGICRSAPVPPLVRDPARRSVRGRCVRLSSSARPRSIPARRSRPRARSGAGRDRRRAQRPPRNSSGGPFDFVAADAEGDHVAIAKLNREVEHPLRFLRTELSDGVENPEQRNAEVSFRRAGDRVPSLQRSRRNPACARGTRPPKLSTSACRTFCAFSRSIRRYTISS